MKKISCLRYVSEEDPWEDFVIEIPTKYHKYVMDVARYSIREAKDEGLSGRGIILHIMERLERDGVECKLLEPEYDPMLPNPQGSWYARIHSYSHTIYLSM